MSKRHLPVRKSPIDSEANKYDKILKENLQALVPTLVRKILGLNVLRTENLPAIKIQTTKEAEPDFLKKVYTKEHPEGFILQLEIEAKDEKDTDAKMLYYIGAEYLKFNTPVDLRMIYLLKGEPKNIKGEVSFFGLKLTYPIYSIHKMPYQEFVGSDVPEEVVLGILANSEGIGEEEIIELILKRLVILKGNSRALWKFINQLKILSMLRNLRAETEKKIHNMELSLDIVRQIKEDEMYKLGIEQGLEQGLEQGERKKTISGIRNMTLKGFEASSISEIMEVPVVFVSDIQEQLKKEKQVIVALKSKNASIHQVAKRLNVSPILVEILAEISK